MTTFLNLLRAELFLLRKRSATWVIFGIWLTVAVLFAYVLPYASLSTGSGSFAESLDTMLPGALAQTIGEGMPFYGGALALILGVLVMGSEYGWNTWKTLLTQRPGRMPIFFAKLATLGIAMIGFVLGAFAIGAISSTVIALLEGATISFPSILTLAEAMLGGWLILTVWATAGVALAMLTRGTSLAIGIGILWGLALEGLLGAFITQIDGLSRLSDIMIRANGYSLTRAINGGGELSADGPGAFAICIKYSIVRTLWLPGVARGPGHLQRRWPRHPGQIGRYLHGHPPYRADQAPVPPFPRHELDQVTGPTRQQSWCPPQQHGGRDLGHGDAGPHRDRVPHHADDLRQEQRGPQLQLNQGPVAGPDPGQAQLGLESVEGPLDLPPFPVAGRDRCGTQDLWIEHIGQIAPCPDRHQSVGMGGGIRPVLPQPDHFIPHALLVGQHMAADNGPILPQAGDEGLAGVGQGIEPGIVDVSPVHHDQAVGWHLRQQVGGGDLLVLPGTVTEDDGPIEVAPDIEQRMDPTGQGAVRLAQHWPRDLVEGGAVQGKDSARKRGGRDIWDGCLAGGGDGDEGLRHGRRGQVPQAMMHGLIGDLEGRIAQQATSGDLAPDTALAEPPVKHGVEQRRPQQRQGDHRWTAWSRWVGGRFKVRNQLEHQGSHGIARDRRIGGHGCLLDAWQVDEHPPAYAGCRLPGIT